MATERNFRIMRLIVRLFKKLEDRPDRTWVLQRLDHDHQNLIAKEKNDGSQAKPR